MSFSLNINQIKACVYTIYRALKWLGFISGDQQKPEPDEPDPLPGDPPEFTQHEVDEFLNSRPWAWLRAIAKDDLVNIRAQLETDADERSRWANTEFQPDAQLRGAARVLRQFLNEWPNEVKARTKKEDKSDG
jgi:hypothetical protein